MGGPHRREVGRCRGDGLQTGHRGACVGDKAGREVLRDVTLQVHQGELAALIGPSGCGKSTFFNLLAGLIEPTAGGIFLGGGPVPHLRGRVAYMQQKDLLLPWRRAFPLPLLILWTT